MAQVWIVPGEAEGQRLDRWLTEQMSGLSRARIQTLIQDGHVQLDGCDAKPSTKLAGGVQVEVEHPPDPLRDLESEPMDIEILHEDDDLVVVNKPSGLVVHPAPGHERGTLVNGLLYGRSLAAGDESGRPGIVHRLDRATSGVLVAAKSDQAYAKLTAQFKDRTVRKTYLALVHGVFRETEGRIEAPIGRNRHHPQEQDIRGVGGKAALTDFEVIHVFEDRTLLAVHPETGRTHQIRVHLKAIDHPVVGDAVYGRDDDSDELMLHAWTLEFTHPRSDERVAFTAAPPPRFRTYVEAAGARLRPRPKPVSDNG